MMWTKTQTLSPTLVVTWEVELTQQEVAGSEWHRSFRGVWSCREAGTTLIADQFPTSNPVWQEVVFLHTLQHFTPGWCYSSINNGAVNRAHKCPYRARYRVYEAQTPTVITEPPWFGFSLSLLKDKLWRSHCTKHSLRGLRTQGWMCTRRKGRDL